MRLFFRSGKKADVENVLDPDWIPWKNLGHNNEDDGSSSIETLVDIECEFGIVPESMQNENFRRELEFDEKIAISESDEIQAINKNIEDRTECLKRIQFDILQEDKIAELKAIIHGLFSVIEDLNAKLKTYKIDIDFFRGDDKKTLYYTGLPNFILLETLIAKLSPFIDRKTSNALTLSQMIILTLMKLRLGLQFTDLGFRFHISKQIASRVFYSCINTLYFKMKGMVYRPPRDQVMSTMPDCFKKNFGDQVTHIIDCVELFIEAPYHFDTRIQCWSEYKHHYTLKYLVSVTPQGMFEFISKGYGGRANDMLITSNCNFLDILAPNDLVLADKGFNMHDVFKIRGVNLEIPAFVTKQKQLHPLAVESTRKIANVRIHVERCIGLLRRKFLILHRIIPVSMLSKPTSSIDNVPFMDKIITVCSALCNLCPSIIPNK